jgi:hypothetical protein
VQKYWGVPCIPLPSPTAGQAIRCNLLSNPNAKSIKGFSLLSLTHLFLNLSLKKTYICH